MYIKIKIIIFYIIMYNMTIMNIYPLSTYDLNCGQNCLYYICKIYNTSISINEIASMTGNDCQNGITMLDIYLSAKKLGLKPIPLKVDVKQIIKIHSPAIAYVDNGHFIVITKYE
jgi:ABC-type bacteriocin/lantibiotic exporter with double-glycine peptidase domain